MKTVSFAIPVFRNKKAVTLTHEKIKNLFKESFSHLKYEIVFVDDGSKDGTLEELIEISQKDSNVKVVELTRNFGQMSAILAGFKNVSGDAVVNISADLQDPVEVVGDMIRSWEKDNLVVIAFRKSRRDQLSRQLTSRLAYKLLRLAIPEIPPGGFDLLMMDREVLDQFNSIDIRNRFLQGDLLWFGYPAHYIPYERKEREHGKSQYTFGKRLKNFLDAFLDSSYLSIRAISAFGAFVALSGFMYSVTVIYSRIVNQTPFEGWAPLMMVNLIIGGIIMLMLGVIGEYIWRIYDELRGKPNFVVKKVHQK
ncbi:MAG: glycosyl transferase family 2 [Bdellovibrionaceae bacterium]|nr:glycosyl transferase family 2 [Pseudobdellovibrionaceae bacterium]|tara:strand:- start:3261 stop:4187 length:927 start_codon:yes stop_codon:yes gene_type:complete